MGPPGEQGPPGSQGETGQPGAKGRRGKSRRYGPLYGYVAASIIFTLIVYGLLFQLRDNQVAGCIRANVLRVEFNQRAEAFGDILEVLIKARGGADSIQRQGEQKANRRERDELIRARDAVDTVPIVNCDDVYPRPWPF